MANVEHERFDVSRFTPPWIKHEHISRFKFAAGFVRDAVVVDCACGSGIGTRLFAQTGAARIYAFDFDRAAVSATRKSCSGLSAVVVSQADATRLPLPDACADVYVSFETIEHVHDDHAVLSEASRVLKPGGRLICSTPNRAVYSPGHSVASTPWNRFHVREYDAGEFDTLLGCYFSQRTFYGQNPTARWRSAAMEKLARSTSGNLAVRINQALKLPRFLYDRLSFHQVEQLKYGVDYEYNVAICIR